MAQYLFQLSYTPEAWTALVKNPQDRGKAVQGVLAKLGGTMQQAWLSFGEYDVVGVMEMPDNVGAAAFSMAVTAGGACRSVKTTPLLSFEEGIEAMKRAGDCGYVPVQRTASGS